MSDYNEKRVYETFQLSFDGQNKDGLPLHELKAEHVSDVLEGLAELTEDFEKAAVFHEEGPLHSELLVRPAQEGSFIMEVCRVAAEDPQGTQDAVQAIALPIGAAIGLPSIGQIIWWATKSARADVNDIEFLDDRRVKVLWQDDTVDVIPLAAWEELNKRKRRRKRQLRKIMRPLEDSRVEDLKITDPSGNESTHHTYTKADYAGVKPSDDIETDFDIFDIEGRLSAIDFDDPDRWRVDTNLGKRTATVEDEDFLTAVADGKPLRVDDVFLLRVREDITIKGGRTTKKWTILEIYGKEENDDESDTSSGDQGDGEFNEGPAS